MKTINELSTALETAVSKHSPQLKHLGSARIAWRSAVHWDGDLWLSRAEEASQGESVPLFSQTVQAQASVRAFDAVTGLVLLESPSDSPTGVSAYPDSSAGVGSLALTLAYPSPDGPEASLGMIRIRPASGQYFQTDANLFQGFAGALVLDSQENFAGIVAQEGRGNNGWVMPAARVRDRVAAMLKFGDLRRPQVGVVLESIALPEGQTGKFAGRGLLVRQVVKGGAAEQAGLYQGDIIVSLGDKRVESPAAFVEELGTLALGSRTTLTRLRGGVQEDLELQPDYRLDQAKD